ncbi:uncharacterized protein F4807DRAFT_253607 [Annulohypoxylon truncatum]|uniref:uncharacterized protein n=1 Tax=Annulohypoxylon truncatum TaxID=327061 RepID=UPI002008410C|nr:uncharacterized protein F4807DRAFT_253607 [Annulohypoxylon truncatum]KAI1205819.1 hypothetical protein F4807DRAFT_253607 [Annulohypoxylon truncatum]
MTRKLPWKRLAERSIASPPKPATPASVRPQKVKRDDLDGGDKEPGASPAPNKRIKKVDSSSTTPNRVPRAGSTSPPPEPLPERYMIEGLENDDLYRMVEDEFLSTAQQFTAHLHAAEYHRLKAASKSQNADTIRDISRPVVGRMTDLVKKKQERKTRFERQKEVIRKARANKGQDGETEREEDSWQSASLYGLMESPRKQATRLDNLTKAITTTRAAAGFSTTKHLSSPTTPSRVIRTLPGAKPMTKPSLREASETEDDDDYNQASPPLEIRTKSTWAASSSTTQPTGPKQAHSITRDSPSSRYSTHTARPTVQKEALEAAKDADQPDDAEADFLARLKRRQEDRHRNREQRKLAASKAQQSKRSTTDDIIPGFL